MYVIQNINDPTLYWSNKYGWCEMDFDFKDTIDMFTQHEKNTLNLPIEGKWVKLNSEG